MLLFFVDVDVLRLRVSVGGLRRYHKLYNNLKALTWHYLCVTVNSTSNTVTSYVDGFRQDEHYGPMNQPITGTEFKVGAGDSESNFHGEITQVKIMKYIIS